MDLDKLFDFLSDEGFQEPQTGKLFFPAYICTYGHAEEYEVRAGIENLNKKLQRPTRNLNSLVLNIYDELISFLKDKIFAGETIYDQIIEKEKENPIEASKWIIEEIGAGEFYEYIENKVKTHFHNDTSGKRVYLLIYGFGTAYPYLRASDFLKNTEALIKDFKIIVFYPGKYKDGHYSLFGELHDDNIYRANHLNNYIG